jgi:hypothetical protein
MNKQAKILIESAIEVLKPKRERGVNVAWRTRLANEVKTQLPHGVDISVLKEGENHDRVGVGIFILSKGVKELVVKHGSVTYVKDKAEEYDWNKGPTIKEIALPVQLEYTGGEFVNSDDWFKSLLPVIKKYLV